MKSAAIQTVKMIIAEINAQYECDADKFSRRSSKNEDTEEVEADLLLLKDLLSAFKKVAIKHKIPV